MLTKLSRHQEKNIRITLDNAFITDYMPYASEENVKVYLLGYSFACSGESENSLALMCKKLNLSETAIKSAFRYWANEGLVNVVEEEPFTVEYLPVTEALAPIRKFSKTKYADYNSQLHAMLPARQILPGEYNEYYSVIEDCHLEIEAMLAIIAYCIRIKGDDISSKYITAVARNMAEKNILTFDRVNEELSQYDSYSPLADKIMKALSSRKIPDHEDRNLLIKWTKNYGFDNGVIVDIAKKYVKKGNFEKLDRVLTKYYENHIFTLEEIEEYVKTRDKTFELTRTINKIIGVYYEQVDYIVETYVSKWLSMGYEEDALKTIAEYCFKRNVKSIEGMNETVDKFYRQGVISSQDLDEYLARAVALDNRIKDVLLNAGLSRQVTSRDRDSYKTWSYSWKMSYDMIMHAASLSQGAGNPIAYMNSLLSAWFNKGIDTIEKAKQDKPEVGFKSNADTKVEKSYTAEQLNAMFDNLSYEDI